MCTVSMVGDHYADKWQPYRGSPIDLTAWTNPIPRAEFDRLTAEVAEMKALLTKALEYDRRTGQANCEQEEKLELLRKVAKWVGVELPV